MNISSVRLRIYGLSVCIDDVAHIRDAIMDMMADESYHLSSEANQICLCLSMAKAVSVELQSPSELAGQPTLADS